MRIKSSANPWYMASRRNRLYWLEIRERIDLAAVAASLLGPAPGRRGAKGRLWWHCPFHDDKNPSFQVNMANRTWKCYGCSEHGDVAALVMKQNRCGFPEAIRWLAEYAGIASVSSRPRVASGRKPTHSRLPTANRPGEVVSSPIEHTSGLPLVDAMKLVDAAAKRIWTPEGANALNYLRGRGLTEATIRSARLGWTPRALGVPWKAPGVVIPWFDAGRLTLIKIRPQDEWRARYPKQQGPPKYIEAYRDRPTLFPAASVVQIGQPLVISEGELDCLLLGQARADLAPVVTLGSASARPEGTTFLSMLPAPAWFVATDSDEAGDKAALGWPARARRVRPPAPFKDWTEAHQAGMDLRGWWTDHLAEIEAPPPRTWEELSVARWGPALTDQTPGVVINGIARV
jgi:DNA primase